MFFSFFCRTEKQLIVNAVKKYQEKNPGAKLREAVHNTSEFNGVRVATVRAFVHEMEATGQLVSNYNPYKERKDAFDKLSEFQRTGIRRTVIYTFKLINHHNSPCRGNSQTTCARGHNNNWPILFNIYRVLQKMSIKSYKKDNVNK